MKLWMIVLPICPLKIVHSSHRQIWVSVFKPTVVRPSGISCGKITLRKRSRSAVLSVYKATLLKQAPTTWWGAICPVWLLQQTDWPTGLTNPCLRRLCCSWACLGRPDNVFAIFFASGQIKRYLSETEIKLRLESLSHRVRYGWDEIPYLMAWKKISWHVGRITDSSLHLNGWNTSLLYRIQ